MNLNNQERLAQSVRYITPVLALIVIVALLAVGQVPVRAEQTEIPQPEYDALMALYNSTDGPNWTNAWTVPTDEPCALYGVTCQDGHVIELDLGSNRLNGSIPPQLGNLTNLSYLSLRVNRLTDEIPSELGNLSNLQTLDLPYNQLSGEIPPELGDMSSLEIIRLARNQLSGEVPPELGNLEKLETLDIPHNQLTGSIPSELSKLGNLTWFNLQDNQLSGSIPPEIGSLTNLHVLSLWGNQLSGEIPAELGTLSNLLSLSVNRNQLSGTIPSELGNLTDLRDLSLAHNQLEGDIPESFVNLVNLRDPSAWEHQGLNLDYNFLNVPTNYPDPDNPLHVLLYSKDPNWHLRQGFKATFDTAGGELLSLDGKTHILIPEGTLDRDTTFMYFPMPIPTNIWERLLFANNSFLLEAEDDLGLPVTTPDPPLTVTIAYSDDDIDGIPEHLLGLYFWDETEVTWMDAVTTCPDGEYERNPDENTFSVPICHLTEFAVFGSYPHEIYLPLVVRGH